MRRWVLAGIGIGLLVATGCATTGERAADATRAPLFDGMSDYTRQATTESRRAQRYFDQGMVWAFAFNHDEAIRSFREAAAIDDSLAIAWWGVALCNGPHINFAMVPPERAAAAWEALQNAQARAAQAGPVERALIEALAARYANPQPADRRPLDEAYAAAMKRVWQQHPSDADVAVLYAESLMDLQPWDLWTPDGQPKGATLEILATLERALELAPDHPGANHLYIHAVEASPNPERGLAAADRLRSRVPISGHLMHMPSHIDVQTGRWAAAADQNELAIRADKRYAKRSPRQGFYKLYMAHNQHFLAFAAMMEGRRDVAEKAAREMVAGVPADYVRTNAALADPYMSIVYDVQKRFGLWDELLAESAPAAELPITTAMWRCNRAVALAAKGDVAAALREQAAFREAAARVPAEAMMAINPARQILRIAEHMLEGEIALAQRDLPRAVSELERAVAIEDTLLYMEPPDWIQPVRHTLGAVLLEARRNGEAEAVYRRDLEIWPENGWSLFGLQQALAAQRDAAGAAEIKQRFERAWARTKLRPSASCLCVTPG